MWAAVDTGPRVPVKTRTCKIIVDSKATYDYWGQRIFNILSDSHSPFIPIHIPVTIFKSGYTGKSKLHTLNISIVFFAITSLLRYGNIAFISWNMIPLAVCSNYLGGNNCLLGSHELLLLTIRHPLFTLSVWIITTTVGQCTIGNVAHWILYGQGPAHSCDVMRHLDSHYPGQWIGWNGPAVWPPLLISLTHADFCLWGHLKSIIYVQESNTWGELWNAIQVAGMTICNMPDVFQWTRNFGTAGLSFYPQLLCLLFIPYAFCCRISPLKWLWPYIYMTISTFVEV